MPLVECVPNVSEGRDATIIEEFRRVVAAVSGAHLLDVHRDPWHHRSVFTLAGRSDPVLEAAQALARAAVARLDLSRHEGEHPRIGALDVVPFVPLSGASMERCVLLARTFARHVADDLDLPAFLYGRAAPDDGVRALADIRRDAFRTWLPDLGPSRPHPTAGAVAGGARDLLVAFNVTLDTPKVEVAREIARRVRSAGGGRPGIQALGFLVDGRAQVSMNLYDPRVTTTVHAFDDVAAHARAHRVAILGSEIVGLAPDAALPSACERIGLPGSITDYSLETALARVIPAG